MMSLSPAEKKIISSSNWTCKYTLLLWQERYLQEGMLNAQPVFSRERYPSCGRRHQGTLRSQPRQQCEVPRVPKDARLVRPPFSFSNSLSREKHTLQIENTLTNLPLTHTHTHHPRSTKPTPQNQGYFNPNKYESKEATILLIIPRR